MINFFVPGIVRPGGSKTAVRRKDGGIGMRPASKYTETWMSVVSYHARQHYQGELLTGVIKASFIFTMKRPKNHYRTNGQLKDWAPLYHKSQPDVGKLVRSTEDALSGIIYRDDSQIAVRDEKKIYGEKIGVDVMIQEIEDGRSNS